MPGNSIPSKNSNEAPPPVDICVILSATPDLLTAETLSPPPMMLTAPELAINFATSKVPFAKFGKPQF